MDVADFQAQLQVLKQWKAEAIAQATVPIEAEYQRYVTELAEAFAATPDAEEEEPAQETPAKTPQAALYPESPLPLSKSGRRLAKGVLRKHLPEIYRDLTRQRTALTNPSVLDAARKRWPGAPIHRGGVQSSMKLDVEDQILTLVPDTRPQEFEWRDPALSTVSLGRFQTLEEEKR